MQDVVFAMKIHRTFEGHQVIGLLNHADDLLVSPGIATDPAWVSVRQVKAHRAQLNPLLHVDDPPSQFLGLLLGDTKDVKSQPSCGFSPNSRKLGQFVDQSLNGFGVDRHLFPSSIRSRDTSE
jgi:hypothetical protein